MLMVLNCDVPTEVSEEDFDFLSGLSFYLNEGYLRCLKPRKYLHQLVLERMGHFNIERTDHEDRNKLNNQRNNLRPSTVSQNAANSNLALHNTSGYKGVSWRPDRNKWRAFITVEYKFIHLGHYNTRQEAEAAYLEAAKQHFGEFANAG